jgi:hypothetical protein
MTISIRLTAAFQRIATEFRAVRTLIGGSATADASALQTSATNLVDAINEVRAIGLSKAAIDDVNLSALAVWSSQKTSAEIQAAVAALVNGAPDALNTLQELAAAMGEDANLQQTLLAAIGEKANAVDVYTKVEVDAAIAAIPPYVLPTATTDVLGGVTVDGTTIAVSADGILSIAPDTSEGGGSDGSYRGFTGSVNRLWGNDPSVNQIIITSSPTASFFNETATVANDDFTVGDLSPGATVAMVNLYGATSIDGLPLPAITTFFQHFIDRVMYDGNTLVSDAATIKSRFEAEIEGLVAELPAGALYENFQFFTDPRLFRPPYTTTGVGTGPIDVWYYPSMGQWRAQISNAAIATGWQQTDQVTISGADLGGLTPQHDLTLTFQSALSFGWFFNLTWASGSPPQVLGGFPGYSITDGGGDQYNDGNYIATSINSEVPYNSGIVSPGEDAFGAGSEYVVLYRNAVWAMVALNTNVGYVKYDGRFGSDSSGTKVVATLVSAGGSVLPYNNAQISGLIEAAVSPVQTEISAVTSADYVAVFEASIA